MSDFWCTAQISSTPGCPPWSLFPMWTGVLDSASSKQSMRFIKSMMNNCLSNHTCCSKEGNNFMPTRLLFVGCGQKPMKLVESDTAVHSYAALSYSWGRSLSLLLTSSNRDSLLTEICGDEIPQTFKDAVRVCHLLAIEYLWIDSLCIQQDDAEDWDREASKMADVYENAQVVISATCCSNTSDSFLARRTTRNDSAVIGWTATTSARKRPLLQVQNIPKVGIHNTRNRREFSDPLEKRAWAYQERVLARRLLDFTSREVQWVCRAQMSCECPDTWGKYRKAQFPWEFDSHMVGVDPKPAAQLRGWATVVQEYSRRQLTYSKDKLPALSGLASRFATTINAPYIAGLWLNNDFILQLIWSRKANYGSMEVNEVYRAPTFSWLSYSGAIICRRIDSRTRKSVHAIDVRIVHVKCNLLSQNPYGEVRGGFMDIVGRLIPMVMLQPCADEKSGQHDGRKMGAARFNLMDGSLVRFTTYVDRPDDCEYFRMRDRATPARWQRSLQWLPEVREDCVESLPCFTLRILSEKADRWHMLLIKSAFESDCFERIGLLVESGNDSKLKMQWEEAKEEQIRIV